MARFNWETITEHISRRQCVYSRPHGITADPIHLLTKPMSQMPAVKEDNFTARLHELAARTGDRYLNGSGRDGAFLDESPIYYVARDGRAIAYITKGGQVVTRADWRNVIQTDMTEREAGALVRMHDALITAASHPHHP